MKTLRLLLSLALSLAAATSTTTNAQERNAVFTVNAHDLRYDVPEKKHNACDVIGTASEANDGEATNTDVSHYAPEVSATVRSAIDKVRRLDAVNGIEGAKFDLQGEITSITTHTSTRRVKRYDTDNKEYLVLVTNYEASIGVTLTLTEIATGQQWTNSFAGNAPWYALPTTEKEAFDDAAEELYKDIISTYNTMFPLVANIIEAGNAKKEKQKDVYIDLGQDCGISKGQHFEVFELQNNDGIEARKKLGRIKVEKVMGDKMSHCKVDMGYKEIKKALDDDMMLLVVSINS